MIEQIIEGIVRVLLPFLQTLITAPTVVTEAEADPGIVSQGQSALDAFDKANP